MKTTLVYSMRAETRWQSITLFDFSWECACGTKFFAALNMSMNDCESIMSIGLGATNKF